MIEWPAAAMFFKHPLLMCIAIASKDRRVRAGSRLSQQVAVELGQRECEVAALEQVVQVRR